MTNPTYRYVADENPVVASRYKTIPLIEDAAGTFSNVCQDSPMPVGLPAGHAATDAFGRLRTSEPTTVYDSKQLHDALPLFYDDQEISGSGTGSAHSPLKASTTMTVSASTAGTRVRQTFQRYNYQPGKSQLILCTGNLQDSGGGAGIVSRMGYFDAADGVYMACNEGALEFRIRSSVTGSPVEEIATQATMNGDPVDGTGPSGVTLDLTKTQIFFTDLEWLGVGTVRVGVVVDGRFILCHSFNHATADASVYMSTPNLPLRYEISNDGTGVASGIQHICSSVISEGGADPTGRLQVESTGAQGQINASSSGTVYAVLGIRLKTTHQDTQIDLTGMSMLCTTNDAFEWLLLYNPVVAGTFTYGDKSNSACQVAQGATNGSNTVSGGFPIAGGFATQRTATTEALNNALRLGASISGVSAEIVLCVRPLANGADIYGSLSWRELGS